MGFSKFSQSDYYFSKHPLRCNKNIPKTKKYKAFKDQLWCCTRYCLPLQQRPLATREP